MGREECGMEDGSVVLWRGVWHSRGRIVCTVPILVLGYGMITLSVWSVCVADKWCQIMVVISLLGGGRGGLI